MTVSIPSKLKPKKMLTKSDSTYIHQQELLVMNFQKVNLVASLITNTLRSLQ